MAMRMRLLQGSILTLLIMGALSCFGQFNSDLQGTVQDNSGAAVAGATVTLKDLDTGVTQSRQTAGNGEYRFPSLSPGRYKVDRCDGADVSWEIPLAEKRLHGKVSSRIGAYTLVQVSKQS